MILKELTNQEFNSFTDNYKDYSIYQTSEYAFVMNKQNYDCIYIGLINNENKIVAASLILIEKNYGFKYAYAPRGFLIDYKDLNLLKEFTDQIKKYFGKKGVIAIKINPKIVKNIYHNDNIKFNPDFENIFNNLKKLDYYHLGYNNFFESFKPRFEAIIDINKQTNLLFYNLKKNLKTKIRTADKSGIRIYKGNKDNLNYLYLQTKTKYPRNLKYYEDMYEFYSKRDMIDFYYAKIDTEQYLISVQKKYQKQSQLCAKINSDVFNAKGNKNNLISRKIAEENRLANIKNELIYATNLLKEFPDGIVTASVLILKYKDQIYIIMDGYDPKYKRFNAKHLLIWKLIEKYTSLGYKICNLGGMSNPKEKHKKNSGLNELKLNYDAECNEYIGDLELITNKPLYLLYRNSSPIRNILKK